MEKLMRVVKFTALVPETQLSNQQASYIISKQLKHYSRAELSQKLKISLRDIRSLLIVVSMIEPRDNALIVSFGDINTVISSDAFYLIFEEGSLEDFYVKFEQVFFTVLDLERNSIFEHSWELLCLETVLYYQVNNLTKQFQETKDQANQSMNEAETAVGQAKLAQCQQLITQINTDCQRASLTLESVLNNELDLARLSFMNQRVLSQNTDQDLESLPLSVDLITDMVESYLFQIRSLTLEAQEMLNLIQNKIELAELNLDHNRNQLMTFELKLTFLTAALDLCCMFAGLFGMNVVVPWTDAHGAFFGVTGGILGFGIVFYVALMIVEKAMEWKKK
ncbi:Conserved_hypothetical protein [Hexamita inflata]|uniref:Magnesium transporter n=1 Tax=Hexamita inflata TaxID=28002 RepID=A0AA86V406_9EUKA|nr:Conserved hypothetical protein [Hexamita inflata]CAI9937810.1 Conserved hypothetical protein [Hexamita inflata]CAI9940224.1 Conserved hypothetical protein [Hexamita inflata]CAI9975626.1 Conserved hypothetical protein [Hexamita inflata]